MTLQVKSIAFGWFVQHFHTCQGFSPDTTETQASFVGLRQASGRLGSLSIQRVGQELQQFEVVEQAKVDGCRMARLGHLSFGERIDAGIVSFGTVENIEFEA